MRSLVQQLENNEAILLMYLAHELGPEDQRDVEQMLARDAAMRGELERLREAQQRVMAQLAALDHSTPLPVASSVAVRQVSRLMKQWQVDRLTRRSESPVKSGLRLPWWAYSAASAAAVLIALLVWWGMRPDKPFRDNEVATVTTQELAPSDSPSEDSSQKVEWAFAAGDENGSIADAEKEASALARRPDDASIADSIFLTDSSQDSSAGETKLP